ncbi:hypothetical protein TWF281_009208 [Arthrobotrys megalospora]
MPPRNQGFSRPTQDTTQDAILAAGDTVLTGVWLQLAYHSKLWPILRGFSQLLSAFLWVWSIVSQIENIIHAVGATIALSPFVWVTWEIVPKESRLVATAIAIAIAFLFAFDQQIEGFRAFIKKVAWAGVFLVVAGVCLLMIKEVGPGGTVRWAGKLIIQKAGLEAPPGLLNSTASTTLPPTTITTITTITKPPPNITILPPITTITTITTITAVTTTVTAVTTTITAITTTITAVTTTTAITTIIFTFVTPPAPPSTLLDCDFRFRVKPILDKNDTSSYFRIKNSYSPIK